MIFHVNGFGGVASLQDSKETIIPVDSSCGGGTLGIFHDHFHFTLSPRVFRSHNDVLPALDLRSTSALAAPINLPHTLDLPLSSSQLWGLPKVALQVGFGVRRMISLPYSTQR